MRCKHLLTLLKVSRFDVADFLKIPVDHESMVHILGELPADEESCFALVLFLMMSFF